MIKINVITNHTNWLQLIKNPNNYIDNKTKKINLENKKFKTKNIFCTLLLSCDLEIRKLNKKFRKINKSTDVLSFPFHTKKNFIKEKKTKNKEIYLGDIIINFDKIKNKKNKKFFRLEFDKLWVHGLVHLFGHDHKTEKDFKKMKKVEKEYLKYIE